MNPTDSLGRLELDAASNADDLETRNAKDMASMFSLLLLSGIVKCAVAGESLDAGENHTGKISARCALNCEKTISLAVLHLALNFEQQGMVR
jgi:hypothetical protein